MSLSLRSCEALLIRRYATNASMRIIVIRMVWMYYIDNKMTVLYITSYLLSKS